MTSFLVICPESDSIEQIMSRTWAQAFCQGATGRAASITDLSGTAATRAAIAGALTANVALMYFGHGQADRLGDPIALIDNRNVSSAAGALIIAFACYSAQKLGPDAIQQQVEAYLGFDDLLGVYPPPANAVATGIVAALDHLALGGTVQEAYRMLCGALDDVVDDHVNGAQRSHPDAPLVLLTARLMRRSLTLCGNQSCSLT
jgi:hypothetical protein